MNDVDAMVKAVIDVLAPEIDGLPATRWPVFRLDYGGQMVMPSDGQVREMAEMIVSAIRTATLRSEA